jgi:hypothetical protein
LNLTELAPGLSSSSQRTLDEIQHPEADVTMHDDESNWEDIRDEVEVLLELSGVYVLLFECVSRC